MLASRGPKRLADSKVLVDRAISLCPVDQIPPPKMSSFTQRYVFATTYAADLHYVRGNVEMEARPESTPPPAPRTWRCPIDRCAHATV